MTSLVMFVRRNVGVLVFLSSFSLLGWFWGVPAVISRSTFAFLEVFLLGGALVTLVTWRNAQAPGSIAQILHSTEVGQPDPDTR